MGDCQLVRFAFSRGSRYAPGGFYTRRARGTEGAGGRAVDVGEETGWFGGDFECGDVLLCSAAVHQCNETKDRLRLSVNYRYQPQSHPVRADSLPHMGWPKLGGNLYGLGRW